MAKETPADKAIRDAADEIRRETRAAAAEVRLELGAAKRETGEALREVMDELRTALSTIWEPEGAADAGTGSGGRMSRAQRKEMTRELLLDAAIEVFSEKGYHGASLDDVADAAGFTKGAVYSNFTRKSDLFRALLEREAGRYDQALAQTIERVPLELLPDVAAELLAAPEAARERQTLLVEFWLAAVRDPSLREPLTATNGLVGAAFEARLQGSDSGPGFDGRELAVLFDALVTGLLMSRELDPYGRQPELLARAMRKLLA
ncbi:MAG: TetR family transcriptional regulator [Candidatus Limnocylindrales bacterium]